MSLKTKIVLRRFGRTFMATALGVVCSTGLHSLADAKTAVAAGVSAVLMAAHKHFTWVDDPPAE